MAELGFEPGLHATELVFTLPVGEWGLRATVAGKSAFLVEEGRKEMGEHQADRHTGPAARPWDTFLTSLSLAFGVACFFLVTYS